MFHSPSYVLVPLLNQPLWPGTGPFDNEFYTEKIEIPHEFRLSCSHDLNSYGKKFIFECVYNGKLLKNQFIVSDDYLLYTSSVGKDSWRALLKHYVLTETIDLLGLPEVAKQAFTTYANEFINYIVGQNFSSGSASTVDSDVSNASLDLPGVSESVKYPCLCSYGGCKDSLWLIIQHLNDICKWSRERIADWVDELHDSGQINAEFQPWDESGLEMEKE